MTTTTIAGATTYYVRISSAQSSGASGDIVYLVCTGVSGTEKFEQKIKNMAGGSAYANRDGKYTSDVSINNCYIAKNIGATNTAEFNLILDQFRKWHNAGAAPIYLHVYNNVDSLHINLGYSPSTSVAYLMGYITDFTWDIASGNIYYFKSIKFKRCTT